MPAADGDASTVSTVRRSEASGAGSVDATPPHASGDAGYSVYDQPDFLPAEAAAFDAPTAQDSIAARAASSTPRARTLTLTSDLGSVDLGDGSLPPSARRRGRTFSNTSDMSVDEFGDAFAGDGDADVVTDSAFEDGDDSTMAADGHGSEAMSRNTPTPHEFRPYKTSMTGNRDSLGLPVGQRGFRTGRIGVGGGKILAALEAAAARRRELDAAADAAARGILVPKSEAPSSSSQRQSARVTALREHMARRAAEDEAGRQRAMILARERRRVQYREAERRAQAAAEQQAMQRQVKVEEQEQAQAQLRGGPRTAWHAQRSHAAAGAGEITPAHRVQSIVVPPVDSAAAGVGGGGVTGTAGGARVCCCGALVSTSRTLPMFISVVYKPSGRRVRMLVCRGASAVGARVCWPRAPCAHTPPPCCALLCC